MPDTIAISENAISALKRLQQRRPARERCELCALPLAERHAHLLQLEERRVVCSCDACALLFQEDSGRYRRIPRDTLFLADFTLDELQWEALSIPINLAFFVFSSAAGRVVAYYPSVGGAIESSLSLEAWQEISAGNNRLSTLRPDVEALLVNRLANPPEYYLAPIDRCYALAGIVRKHWSGFTGGDEVWNNIGEFFAVLRNESITVGAQRA